MGPLIKFIEEGDFCGTLLLVGFVCFVGSKVVQQHPVLQRAGFQLAAVSFLAYVIYGGIALSPSAPEDFLGIGLRGLLAGGLFGGIAWIVLPMLTLVYRHTLGAMIVRGRAWAHASKNRNAERRAKDEEERRRRRAEDEYQRDAPRREQLQREAEVKARQDAEAQKRRDDSRASCEILYSLYAPDIAERFDRQAFSEFVAKYLSDKHTPEYVEERAQQLQTLLQQHREQVDPSPKFKTLGELTHWFELQKEQVETMPDGRLKSMLLAKLNGRYAELTSQLLEELEP